MWFCTYWPIHWGNITIQGVEHLLTAVDCSPICRPVDRGHNSVVQQYVIVPLCMCITIYFSLYIYTLIQNQTGMYVHILTLVLCYVCIHSQYWGCVVTALKKKGETTASIYFPSLGILLFLLDIGFLCPAIFPIGLVFVSQQVCYWLVFR